MLVSMAIVAAGAAAANGIALSERPVSIREIVTLEASLLRVGDLIVERGRLSPEVAQLVVARLPGRAHYALSAEAAAALVRRRVPGLIVAVPDHAVRITIARAPGNAPVRQCHRTTHALAPGKVLRQTDVTPARCGADAVTEALSYRGGYVIVREAIAQGAQLGTLPPLDAAGVDTGAELTLRAQSGAMVVERDVTAVQPGRSGGQVFVRSADGAIFAAPLAVTAP